MSANGASGECSIVPPPLQRGATARKTPGLGAFRHWHGRLISFVSVAAVLGLWQLSGAFGWIDALLLPPPGEVLRTAEELIREGYRQVPLWQHIGISIGRALAAFAAAVAVGVPLGLSMGLVPVLASAIDPFVQFLRPLPKIALIPLVVVWFGIGEGAKFFLIFIATVLSIIVGAAAAAGGISRARVRVAQTLGASRRQILLHVVLPDALPEIFTCIRLSVGVGWTSLIAAEMVAADAGLGWLVINAGSYLRTDVVMLGILLLGLSGYAFDWLLLRLQERFAPWSGKES